MNRNYKFCQKGKENIMLDENRLKISEITGDIVSLYLSFKTLTAVTITEENDFVVNTDEFPVMVQSMIPIALGLFEIVYDDMILQHSFPNNMIEQYGIYQNEPKECIAVDPAIIDILMCEYNRLLKEKSEMIESSIWFTRAVLADWATAAIYSGQIEVDTEEMIEMNTYVNEVIRDTRNKMDNWFT